MIKANNKALNAAAKVEAKPAPVPYDRLRE